MKYIKKYAVNLIWLLVLGVFAILFALLRNNTELMTFIVRHITRVYRDRAGYIASLIPISLAELIWVAAILWVLVYTVLTIVRLVRHSKPEAAVHYVLNIACVALSAYAGFTLLWGADYYALSFETENGITTAPVSVEQLYSTTAYFTRELCLASALVPRGEDMIFNGDVDEIFDSADGLYAPLISEYKGLCGRECGVKRMLLSPVLSLVNFTGFYFPFTGESTINTAQPAADIPATIAHELAHKHGVPEEDVCNFLAIRACELSGDAMYKYSGLKLGYTYLANALYAADSDKWQALASTLTPEVIADLDATREYWTKYETPVATVTDAAYEGFLQGYGETDGLASYGKVVDLLVQYYK